MIISTGKELPDTTFKRLSSNGIEQIALSSLTTNKKTIIFGMPGAFTTTCTNDHIPGIIQCSKSIFGKGVDEILCIVVNDVYVAHAWAEDTGATLAGIKILADTESKFTKSIGLEFSAPAVGFFNRLQRMSLISENNIVVSLQLEESRGVCDLTSARNLLSLL